MAEESIQVRDGEQTRAVSFFGPPEQRLFGVVTAPLADPVAGVVICSPILAEFAKNYRREVLLTAELASRGLAVQRFHYRGAGHSDGSSEDAVFATMIEDAHAAADDLVQATGLPVVAYVGIRLGGLVAAAAAGDRGLAMALWEPVVDPVDYIRQVLRVRLINRMLHDDSGPGSVKELEEQLQVRGMVDVAGYPVTRALYESLHDQTLVRVAGDSPRSALLVEFSARETLRDEYAGVAEGWRRSGWSVETTTVAVDESWWFMRDAWQSDEAIRTATTLLGQTADWVAGQVVPAGAGA